MSHIKLWKSFSLAFLLLIIFGGILGGLNYHGQKPFFTSFILGLIVVSPLVFLFVCYLIRPINEIIMAMKKLMGGQLDRVPKFSGPYEFGTQMREIFDLFTERKNQFAEITKEKEYLEAVLNGIGEGVLVANAEGRILRINEALRQLLSLPADAQAQMPLEIIRQVELQEAIKGTIQDGQKRSFEFTPPLGQRTFRVNVVGFNHLSRGEKENREQNKGAIAIFHDITRLKELERIRQDFVANVSHELRTPLTTIKGYVETLIDGALKEEIAEQFIQVIKRQADRLIKIVEDLLTLSKIESKEFQLRIEEIHLSEFVDELLTLFSERAERKKISLIKQEFPSHLSVLADRNYLELVFINLLDNAIKYNIEGGSVTIAAEIQDEKYLLVFIRDTGIGIPREDLPRIFERFYRVEKGRSKEHEGTGLGLSIVKHIIQAHGGKIWAESQPGKGSIFYFDIPLRPLQDSINT